MSDTPTAGITSSSINATPVPPQRPPVEAALNDVHNSIDALEVVANALLEGGELVGDLLARGALLPAEDRELCGIPAELPRQLPEAQPALVAALHRPAGQLFVDEPGHDHEIPLEALRAVDGEDLHRARLRILGAGREVFA